MFQVVRTAANWEALSSNGVAAGEAALVVASTRRGLCQGEGVRTFMDPGELTEAALGAGVPNPAVTIGFRESEGRTFLTPDMPGGGGGGGGGGVLCGVKFDI